MVFTVRAVLTMPSLRQSYTVTVPEEPPASVFPFSKAEARRKSASVSRSMLVSTFVGLLINQAKVRAESPRGEAAVWDGFAFSA